MLGERAETFASESVWQRRAPHIEFVSDASSLTAEWDDLADRMRAGPFLRPGWITAWWQAFGKGRLSALVARRGALVGIVPVHRGWDGLRTPANAHSPEFGILATDELAARTLGVALFRGRPRRVALGAIDMGGATAGLVRNAAVANGYRIVAATRERSPHLRIDGDWPAYVKSLRTKMVAELRRRRRALEKEGSVTIDVDAGRDGRLATLLDEGFRVETSGWKAERGTAIVSRDDTHRFYRAMSAWAAERGILRLTFLRVDGRPIAFQLALQDAGTLYLVKCGYDSAFHRFAPVRLLVHELIGRAFADGLARIEFLGGDEPWKLEWTSSCRDVGTLYAFAPTILGGADHLATTTWLRRALPLGKRIRTRLRRVAVARQRDGSGA